jgi:hypothetical protein
MLLSCTSKGSTAGTAIQRRGLFSVNILGPHRSEICARFTGQADRAFRIFLSCIARIGCRCEKALRRRFVAASPRSTTPATTTLF